MYTITNRCYSEWGSRTNYFRSSMPHYIQSNVDDFFFTLLYLPSKHTTSSKILSKIFRIKPPNFVDYVWNVMAHAQKPEFVFRRNGRVHLNRRGRQCNRLLAAEVCVSEVVMLDTSCSVAVWRVLATHSIHQFPLEFPSRTSPCAITFQLDSTSVLQRSCFTM
jgi:hypothetical protein